MNQQTYGHDDDQTRRDVRVEEIVAQTSFQYEHHLQASEVAYRTKNKGFSQNKTPFRCEYTHTDEIGT